MNNGIDVAVPEVPTLLQQIGQRLVEVGVQDSPPSVYVLNKYPVGYKISRHVDHKDNGPVIPVCGIASACEMILTHRRTGKKYSIDFQPRSLVVLTKESRYDYFHEILPVKALRWALVFRNIPSP